MAHIKLQRRIAREVCEEHQQREPGTDAARADDDERGGHVDEGPALRTLRSAP